MNKTTEALKLAEKTLRDIIRVYKFETGTPVTALAAIREALSEPVKQEPVAWLNPHNQAVIDVRKKKQIGEGKGYPNFSIPLYAAPVERQWVDLTDDELRELIRKEHDAYCLVNAYTLKFARAVIAAFKEKNK